MNNTPYPSALAGEGVKMLVLDVDGVLTNNQILLDAKGEEYKPFHVPDGTGLKLLMRSGVHVAWISGRASQPVHKRALELGIQDCITGVKDKVKVIKELIERYQLDASELLYLGDDLIDIPPMKFVGRAVAVANAHAVVKDVAQAITEINGGEGAVREVCEWVLHINGDWQAAMESYLQ